MPATSRTHPELLGPPRRIGRGIAHVHLCSAPLTANLDPALRHLAILARRSGSSRLTRRSRQAAYNVQMIPAIILAAGRSSRMGRPKALLPLPAGDLFVCRIAATLNQAGVDDIVVVVGADERAIVEAIARTGLAVRFARNLRESADQISSMQVGLNTVDRPGVRAVLVTLVDLPLVSAETVQQLLAVYRRTAAPIVRPVNNGRHGHPVVFDRGLFSELRQAAGPRGAKDVVERHRAESVDVPVTDPGVFDDIDTPEDYERLLKNVRNDSGE